MMKEKKLRIEDVVYVNDDLHVRFLGEKHECVILGGVI